MTRTERTYYLVFGLYNLWAWFLAPVYPLFLASRGLDPFEVNLILATYLIVIFVFEVPTGAAADLMGRKASFLLSCAVRALAFGLYAVAQSFTDCATAEVLDGIGTTLASGALDAWAVDGMKADGHQGPIDRLFVRAQMVLRAAAICGGVVCAYLAAVDFSLPWWVAAAGFVATGIVAAVLMREPPIQTASAAERSTFWRTMHDGFGAVRGVPVLMLVCALTAASFFAVIPAHMLWQARIVELTGEGVWVIGWVWVFLNLAPVAGSVLLPRILERARRERVLCLAVLWRGALLSVAAFATSLVPTLAGWLLQEMSFGLTEPVMQSWMNEHVPAQRRATVLSIRSMCGTLAGGVGLAAIGLVARDSGISAAWTVSAILLLLTAPAYLLLGRLAPIVGPATPPLEAAEPITAKVIPTAAS